MIDLNWTKLSKVPVRSNNFACGLGSYETTTKDYAPRKGEIMQGESYEIATKV